MSYKEELVHFQQVELITMRNKTFFQILDGAVRSKKPSIFNQSDSDSDEPGQGSRKKKFS